MAGKQVHTTRTGKPTTLAARICQYAPLARNTAGLQTLLSEDFEFVPAFFAEHFRLPPDQTLPDTLNFDRKSHCHQH